MRGLELKKLATAPDWGTMARIMRAKRGVVIPYRSKGVGVPELTNTNRMMERPMNIPDPCLVKKFGNWFWRTSRPRIIPRMNSGIRKTGLKLRNIPRSGRSEPVFVPFATIMTGPTSERKQAKTAAVTRCLSFNFRIGMARKGKQA